MNDKDESERNRAFALGYIFAIEDQSKHKFSEAMVDSWTEFFTNHPRSKWGYVSEMWTHFVKEFDVYR